MDPGGNLDVNCVETGNLRRHCCINLMLGLKLLLFDGWGFRNLSRNSLFKWKALRFHPALAPALSLQMLPAGSPRAQEAMFWWLSSSIVIKAKWIIIVLMNFILEKIRVFFNVKPLSVWKRKCTLISFNQPWDAHDLYNLIFCLHRFFLICISSCLNDGIKSH